MRLWSWKWPVVGSELRDLRFRVLSLEIWDLVLLASSLAIKVVRLLVLECKVQGLNWVVEFKFEIKDKELL